MPDNRWVDAPHLPTDRPPTKAEVWAWVQHIYAGVKTHEDQVRFAREKWAWHYILRVCIGGWDKQPDWIEGEPVIREAVPRVGPGGIESGSPGRNIELVERCLRLAKQRRAA